MIPRRVRDSQVRDPEGVQLCACQYGMCGWCSAGNHKECTAGKLPTGGTPVPAAYITNSAGVIPFDVRAAQVWEAGHVHAWVCSCHRARHGGKAGPPGQQGDLLDLLGAA